MTLKEKIMKLQTYKMFVGEDTVYVERDDVLKLLGQEPTTKNDLAVDCISRKAVLEMAKSYNTDGYDMYTPLVVDVEDIEELPSVTPIRPKGHWKTDRQGDMQCSRCGHQRPYFIDYTSEGCKVRGELTPFCPKCGSDNREVEE